MRKVASIVSVLILTCLISAVCPLPVQGWAGAPIGVYDLHAHMTKDTLEGARSDGLLSFSDAEINWIAEQSNAVDSTEAGPHHRVTYYDGVFRDYEGEPHLASGEEGAERWASDWISGARTLYAAGDTVNAGTCLGYAIHYIQDAVCPAHVFPFELGWAHLLFEKYTWEEYADTNWPSLVASAAPTPISSAEDLRQEIIDAAHWVNDLACGFTAPDGRTYSSLDGIYTDIGMPGAYLWIMSDDNIGLAMEKAAQLVKGAAIWARFGPAPSVDVFMLVDLTGSFYDDLPAFKSQAPDLMATLKSSYPDIRFGLGKFEDYPISPFGDSGSGDKAYERLIDLTSDVDTVLSIIAGLYTRYGADEPESQLVALYQSATGDGQDLSGLGYPGASVPAGQQANFRDGATKLFLLWTDASFHHPGDPGSIPYPGPSFDETVEAILALDPPMVIGISSGGGGLADLEAIAAATGALAPSGGIDTNGDGIVDIPEGEPLVATIGYSGQGIATAIQSLVEAAVVLPIADAGGPYTGEVGDTIVFDGSGSFDPDGWITLYEWDFESDGVFDFSSTGPAAEHAYSAEFSGVVTLRVTGDDGNTAIGTAPVEILPRGCIPLETIAIDPETMNRQVRGRWLTAYIELPDGYAVEDVDIGTIQLLYNSSELSADWGDIQDGVLMVKFDRATAAAWFDGIHDEEVELTVVGEVGVDCFEGTDTIRVIGH